MLISTGPQIAYFLLSISLLSCVPPAVSPPVHQSVTIPAPQPVILPTGAPPSIVGESAIVIDAVTGRILAGKNEDKPRAVASTQKLMTALLVVEAGPLSDPLTIQQSDTTVEPTKLYLRSGDRFTRGDLLKAILVRSANDASVALARDVAGSVEGFAVRMNQRARSLGMHNSNFRNPHGLTVEGQFSTARDMARLARAAYRHSAIRGPMTIREYNFVHNDGTIRKLVSTNKLLKRLSWVTGMKTGTTRASGKCLIASGSLLGRTVIVVVLGSTPQAVWNDSEKLLRWALETPHPAQTAVTAN
jgi:D-alanyl-D-alanine carboxypeptidase (penicillin-binding protein 5/6)